MPLLHRNIKNIFNYSSICALFGQYFPFFVAGVQSWAGGGPQQICAAVAAAAPGQGCNPCPAREMSLEVLLSPLWGWALLTGRDRLSLWSLFL